MKKIISSVIILIILLLTIWSLSAWVLGNRVQEDLRLFFEDTSHKSSELIDTTLLSFSPSIFGSKAQVLVEINQQNPMANFIGDSISKVYFDIDIQNGPLLISKSRIKLGSSSWKITLNRELNDDENSLTIKNSHIKQLPVVNADVSFEDVIDYIIPLKLNYSEILLKGKYDLKTSINSGSIKTNTANFSNKNYQLNTKDINLHFTHHYDLKSDIDNDTDTDIDIDIDNEITFTGSISDLNFRHKNMSEDLILQINYAGNSSMKKGVINSQNSVQFIANNSSIYPLGNGELNFLASNVVITNFTEVLDHISQISNLKNQKQWILEEQGELPEGQDQIWLLQDQIDQQLQTLPKSISNAFISTNEITDKKYSVLNFSIINKYNGNQSDLYGELKPLDELASLAVNTDISILSLTELKSKVSLDDTLYKFISSQLPLKNNEFELIFKQNKLLMQ